MKKKSKRKKEEVKLKGNKNTVLAVIAIILVIIATYLVFQKPEVADQGDTVLVEYVAMVKGAVFDTNIEKAAREAGIHNPEKSYEPLELVVGQGRFIKGFEDAIYGMEDGETKTVTIPPELAYGEYDPRNIASFNLSRVNNSEEVREGTVVSDRQGNVFKIIEVNETSAVVDLNHPLAGETLTFTIELLEVR